MSQEAINQEIDEYLDYQKYLSFEKADPCVRKSLIESIVQEINEEYGSFNLSDSTSLNRLRKLAKSQFRVVEIVNYSKVYKENGQARVIAPRAEYWPEFQTVRIYQDISQSLESQLQSFSHELGHVLLHFSSIPEFSVYLPQWLKEQTILHPLSLNKSQDFPMHNNKHYMYRWDIEVKEQESNYFAATLTREPKCKLT